MRCLLHQSKNTKKDIRKLNIFSQKNIIKNFQNSDKEVTEKITFQNTTINSA